MEFQPPFIDYSVLWPFIFVAGTGLLLMIVDLLASGERSRRWAPVLSIAGLIGSLVTSLLLWNDGRSAFSVSGGQPMLVADNFAVALNVIFALTGILTVLLSVNYLQRTGHDRPEFYMLTLFSLSGMMLMGMANDLILIFLALELLSIPLYILAGSAWPRPESEESALKYFIIGAFSSAIFVYGIALIYGATGTTSLPGVLAAAGGGTTTLLLAGAAMMLVGFAFKIAAAPFHMWAPDVYEGAPTVVTAFMSVGAKVGGFAALLRILMVALPNLGETWAVAVSVMAALTLIIGNVLAIAQPNIKRMLGYSSIAHAGYILVGLVPGTASGASAALFYLFTYAFMNIGAFAIVIALEKEKENDALQNRAAGIAARWPLMAAAMALFMFSLSGMPPLAGFFGKFFVFKAAVDGGWTWLAVIGMLNSAIGLYYYLRVTVAMYFEAPGANAATERREWNGLRIGVALAAIFTILIGIYPALWAGIFRAGLGG